MTTIRTILLALTASLMLDAAMADEATPAMEILVVTAERPHAIHTETALIAAANRASLDFDSLELTAPELARHAAARRARRIELAAAAADDGES